MRTREKSREKVPRGAQEKYSNAKQQRRMNKKKKNNMQYPQPDCYICNCNKTYTTLWIFHNSCLAHICLMRMVEPPPGRRWIHQSKLKTMLWRSVFVRSSGVLAFDCARERFSGGQQRQINSKKFELRVDFVIRLCPTRRRSWETKCHSLYQNHQFIWHCIFFFWEFEKWTSRANFSRRRAHRCTLRTHTDCGNRPMMGRTCLFDCENSSAANVTNEY